MKSKYILKGNKANKSMGVTENKSNYVMVNNNEQAAQKVF